MSYITVGKEKGADIQIYYKGWGSGQPRFQPRLAAVGRRLGRADAVLPQTRVSRHRARPAGPWPLYPDRWWPRYGIPYADSAPLSAKLLKNVTLKTYQGFPHGILTTEAATINANLLAFVKS